MTVEDWDEKAAHYYNGLDFLNSYSKSHELNILFVGPKGQWICENNDYNIDIVDIEDFDSISVREKLSNNDTFYDLIIYYPYSFVPTDYKVLEFLQEMAFQISSESHKRVSLGFYGQIEQDDFNYDDVRFIRWNDGKHWYAKIGDIDICDQYGNYKSTNKYYMMRVAKQWCECGGDWSKIKL